MTFDLLIYSEDKVKEIITVPDATLSTMLSALLDKVGAEADREGRFCLLTDENEVATVLDSFNIPQAQEAFYAYCERIGVDVVVYTLGCVMVRLQWTVQSLKDAKAKNTKENKTMRNSREEPLLPIGSLGNVVGHSNHRGRVVEILAYEKGYDYYIVGYKGSKLRLPCSDVTAYTGD